MPRPQIVIENPILNTPFAEPERHFRFDDEGITDDVVEGRRPSSYFMPIPKAKKKGGQLVFDEWTGDRIEENRLINQIRDRVARWRELGWPSVTPTTRSLLEYWTNPDRERPLFFCQIEALETAIYLTEAGAALALISSSCVASPLTRTPAKRRGSSPPKEMGSLSRRRSVDSASCACCWRA